MKIDINAHCLTLRFADAFSQRVGMTNPARVSTKEGFDRNMCDIDRRIAIIDKFPELVQVLTPTIHTLEAYAKPEDAAYLAKIYNDDLAELVSKYPDKFVAAVACLPWNNLDAALKEIERAIKELGFKGILINTSLKGKPLDSPELMPVYELMSSYDLPIWIHPTRLASVPDYPVEDEAKYWVFLAFGWPYETTVAMSRLVCSEILDKYPNLKFITHHAGGLIPFFAGRIIMLQCPLADRIKKGGPDAKLESLMKHFRMFYNDTALYGNTPGLMCSHEFFGTEHLLFGTDMPYGPAYGEYFIEKTIEAVDKMSLPDSDKRKIYEDNARKLLHLDL